MIVDDLLFRILPVPAAHNAGVLYIILYCSECLSKGDSFIIVNSVYYLTLLQDLEDCPLVVPEWEWASGLVAWEWDPALEWALVWDWEPRLEWEPGLEWDLGLEWEPGLEWVIKHPWEQVCMTYMCNGFNTMY